jgi:hypothetical protein
MIFHQTGIMQAPVKPESKPGRMLSDVVHEKLRAGHYSRRTEEAYLGWIRRFIKYHGGRHPREMGKTEVEAFLSYLTTAKNVAASTQNGSILICRWSAGFGPLQRPFGFER